MGLEGMVRKTFPWILSGSMLVGCGKIKDILGMDKKKSTETTAPIETIENHSGETDIFHGKTKSNGEVNFVDETERIKINVTVSDEVTGESIKDMSVAYFDGPDYGVLLATDSNREFSPVLKILSEEELAAKSVEGGFRDFIEKLFTRKDKDIIEMDVVDGESEFKALYSWQRDATRSWKDYGYVRTVSNDERLELREQEFFVLNVIDLVGNLYSGGNSPLSLKDLIEKLYPEPENAPKKWDLYKISFGTMDFNGKKIVLGTNYYDLVPSNVPTVSINEPEKKEDEVVLSWEGEDKDTYELPFFFESQHAPKKDLTGLLGDSEESDLFYCYRVSKDGEIVVKDSTFSENVSLSGLEDGDYNLEVLVRDEVGNESGVNMDFRKLNELDKILFEKTKIAFGCGDIQTINLDGSNYRNLIMGWDPCWSPDGERIAFSGWTDENMDIYVMNLDGSDLRRLTYLEGVERGCSWSPDGERIVFSSRRNKRHSKDYSSRPFDIYVMDLNGSDPTNITKTPVASEIVSDWFMDNAILFESSYNLYVLNLDTNERKKINVEFDVSWASSSRDGSKIVLSSRYLDMQPDIFIIDYATEKVTRLTNDFNYNITPSFSPDGRKIAFISSRDEGSTNWSLYIMDLDGSNMSLVKDHVGAGGKTAWSPYLK